MHKYAKILTKHKHSKVQKNKFRSLFLKGQLSIEFLLIVAIFFSILFLFVSKFIEVKSNTEESINKMMLLKYANDLKNTINTICILGDGNVRYFEIYSTKDLILKSENYKLTISSINETQTVTSNCKINISSTNSEINVSNSKLKIENKDGKIEISVQ